MYPLLLPSPYSVDVITERGRAGMEKEEDRSHVVSDLHSAPPHPRVLVMEDPHCCHKKLL